MAKTVYNEFKQIDIEIRGNPVHKMWCVKICPCDVLICKANSIHSIMNEAWVTPVNKQ